MSNIDDRFPNLPEMSADDLFDYFADMHDAIGRDTDGDFILGDVPPGAVFVFSPRILNPILEAVNLTRRVRKMEAEVMDRALNGEELPEDTETRAYYIQVEELIERVNDLEQMVVALEHKNAELAGENLVLKHGKRRWRGW